MAVKNREQVGTVNCALCGNEATVHTSKIGRGGVASSLYYRCGTTSSGCGCIQPRGPSGQAWIKQHMRPLDTKPAPKVSQQAEPEAPAANDPGEYVPGEQETGTDAGKTRRSGGLLGWLLDDEDENL
ncbi:hypothetical protein [Alcanivorax sp. NBRC 102024]|uniref:hypothetical protein n=1 Tax=Alcanivorax sp. NBRC 102024 TaxID=1113895 RepID=UPI000789E509|nr:hypothetical protein [Alcanivorax sp. NBRC 102024]